MPLFLLSTSLLLLLERLRLHIDSSDKGIVDTSAYTDLMSTLHNSIDHANKIAPKNKQTIETELGKITGVYRRNGICISAYGTAGCQPNYWAWIDETGNEHKYDDTAQGGCSTNKVEHKDKADQERNQQYSKYHQELFAQYGNPDKVSAIIAAWGQAVKEFEKYKP